MKKKEQDNIDFKKIDDIENIVPCQLPFFNLSCFGCCGRNFRSEDEILEDIKENTKDFNKIKHKTILRMLSFRDRFSSNPDDLKRSGICSNLVNFSNCVACPLHPLINKLVDKREYKYPAHKKDLRKGHCDINYECETMIIWKSLSNSEKKDLLIWIGKNYNNNYKYSIDNIEGSLLKKFSKN